MTDATDARPGVIPMSQGHFVHLGLGATIATLPRHTGDLSWYEDYGAAQAGDGAEGRLVSLHTFDTSWDTWEMHPKGHELVLCTAGAVSLIQEHPDGTVVVVALSAGDAAVNEPGVWHTADIAPGDSATCCFITAGLGTEIRPRE